jgi:uncharacterized protein (UPF0332 family)
MVSETENHRAAFEALAEEGRIVRSGDIFKIGLFLEKGRKSLMIAGFLKGIVPSKDLPKKLFWDYWAITISYYSMLYAAKAAILSKGYEARDHDAVQTALGRLLVPSEMERADLELLNQSHKIFEEEYVEYFEDAKRESHIARYSAIKTYTERRLDEIFTNATRFIAQIALMLQE